jgi:hypothetical protein
MFHFVCKSCGSSYPEEGQGLKKIIMPGGDKSYRCPCGGRVELRELQVVFTPTGTKKGQTS